MENSMNSYMQQKPVASRETTGSPDHDDQESGWTAYFEDFSNYNNNRDNSFCSSYIGSSSLVSDAAYSGAAWNHPLPNNHHHHHLITACSSIGGSQKIPKKLKFKKTRTKEICADDSLEDTASSPVNSPKVTDLEPFDMNHPSKADPDHMYSSLGKGSASEQYYYSQLQREERSMNKGPVLGSFVHAIHLNYSEKGLPWKTPPCAEALKAGEEAQKRNNSRC